jgi:DNA-binding MarR family transcriptional regulator
MSASFPDERLRKLDTALLEPRYTSLVCAEEVGLLSRDDAEEDRRQVYFELTGEAERRLFGALNEMDEHRGDIAKAFDELTRSFRQTTRRGSTRRS